MTKFLIFNISLFFLVTTLTAHSFETKDKQLILKSDDWKVFCKLYPSQINLINNTEIEGCNNAFKNTFNDYFTSNKNFKAWSATVNKKSGFIDGVHYGVVYGVINNQTRANVESYDLCAKKNNYKLTDFNNNNECAIITIGNKIVHKKTISQFEAFSKNKFDSNEEPNISKILIPPSIPVAK